MTGRLTLRLPSECESITRLLDALEAFAREHDIPMAAMAPLSVLADELAANVVMHARGATQLEASLHHVPGLLTFILADDGEPFDPLAQSPPDITAPMDERDIGGLGIHLVRQMASSVDYRYEAGRNILTLTLADGAKRVRSQPELRTLPMQITSSAIAGMTVATLDGRLDTATAPAAEGELMGMLAAPGLVLDMARVRYVSSAGLRLLLKMAKEARGRGAKFALVALQPAVRDVFEISGFDKIIPTFTSLADATAA